MAKTPSYQPAPDPPPAEPTRFLPHASAVALGGQVTAMAKVPKDERTWRRRTKLVPAVRLTGATCAVATVGSVAAVLRNSRMAKGLGHAKLTVAEASVVEKPNGYVSTVLAVAEKVQLGLVAPVTFPLSEVLTKWTYVDRQTPQKLDLRIRFAGYQVGRERLVPVKIRTSWSGLTFESVAKQIDDGTLQALPWSTYQRGQPGDQLAVTLARDYHVHIPTLGHVYFAELAMTPYHAVFTLVRVVMGSPADGIGVIACAIPNGGRFP
jgi:hypothetical protein